MSSETKKVGPPPTAEVAIRTLESDAKSIAAGEIDPQPEIVNPEKVTPAEQGSITKEKFKKKKWLLWTIVTILILAILGVGYFILLPKFQNPGTTIEVNPTFEE